MQDITFDPMGLCVNLSWLQAPERFYVVDAGGKMVTDEILVPSLRDGALEYKGLIKQNERDRESI